MKKTILMAMALCIPLELAAADWLLIEKDDGDFLPRAINSSAIPPIVVFKEGDRFYIAIANHRRFTAEERGIKGLDHVKVEAVTAGGAALAFEPVSSALGGDGHSVALALMRTKPAKAPLKALNIYQRSSPELVAMLEQRAQQERAREKRIATLAGTLGIAPPVQAAHWSLAGENMRGDLIDTNTLNSKWTIVDMYAQWCSPCIKAIPRLNALDAHGDIEVVGVTGVSDKNALARHTKKYQINYEMVAFVGKDMDSALSAALDSPGFPTYFLLDKNKILVGKYSGSDALARIEARIMPAALSGP